MQISEVTAVFIAALLAAHLLGDFFVQTPLMVERKQEHHLASHFIHSLLHAVLAYGLAGYWRLSLIPAVTLAAHFIIDCAEQMTRKYIAPLLKADGAVNWRIAGITIDQLLHVAVILALAILILPQTNDGFWNEEIGELWPVILVIVCGATICINVGGVVIGILIQPFLSAIQNQVQDGSEPKAIGLPLPRGFPNGGRVIGQLERLLIFVLILNAQYTAVGFLVAAKSIFRFGELNDPKVRMESEYIIIGTMMSFAWAIITSWATAYVLQIVR